MKNKKPPLPVFVEALLINIGQNIRIARLRRKMRLEDLAIRVGISRYSMSDIEKGKTTVAIGSYLSALWALGLTENLSKIGDSNLDVAGIALERARAPKTAPKRKGDLNNDF
jgi:transcriptional regulator with XRE-family HTH domain